MDNLTTMEALGAILIAVGFLMVIAEPLMNWMIGIGAR